MARRILLNIAAAAAFVAVSVAMAAAQMQACGERSEIVQLLEKRFQEQQHGYGLVGNQAIVEFFRSPAGSWTILMTRADRMTCVVAAGHGWEEIPLTSGQGVNWKR